jgi:hypothetical protein
VYCLLYGEHMAATTASHELTRHLVLNARHDADVWAHPAITPHEDDLRSAARGIVVGLLLCVPFWMALYFLLF